MVSWEVWTRNDYSFVHSFIALAWLSFRLFCLYLLWSHPTRRRFICFVHLFTVYLWYVAGVLDTLEGKFVLHIFVIMY